MIASKNTKEGHIIPDPLKHEVAALPMQKGTEGGGGEGTYAGGGGRGVERRIRGREDVPKVQKGCYQEG